MSQRQNLGFDRSISVKVQKLSHYRGDLPSYQSHGASGFDVRAQLGGAEPIVLQPGQRTLVPTGMIFEVPNGFELQARPRSGWALRSGVTLLNTPGTIDSDYRGEVKILVINLGDEIVRVEDQDRIAQLVLCPIYQVQITEVETLTFTERGAGGFGSTGLR